jgi:hypothetical protein
MRKYVEIVLIVIVSFQFSCSEEDEIIRCDARPSISESMFGTSSAPVTITGASILTNCLEIRFSYTGCTDVATYDLVASEVISDTFPPSRAVRIVLFDEGSCSITQTQTYRVDLTILQVENTNRLNLELEGWGEPLVYGY